MAVKTCGSDFLLQIFRDGAWETVAHQKDTAGNGTDELVDVTDKQDSIKYRFALPGCGIRAVQLTASGYTNDSASFEYLNTSFGTQSVQARLLSDGVPFWEAEYKITQFVRQATYNGAEEYALVLESANTVTDAPLEECQWFDEDAEAIADADAIGICVIQADLVPEFTLSASASGGTPNELIVCIQSLGNTITNVATAGNVTAGAPLTLVDGAFITGEGTDTLCINYPKTFTSGTVETQFDVLINGIPVSGAAALRSDAGVRIINYVWADTTFTLDANFLNVPPIINGVAVLWSDTQSGEWANHATGALPVSNLGTVVISAGSPSANFDIAPYDVGTYNWPFRLDLHIFDWRFVGSVQAATQTRIDRIGGPSVAAVIGSNLTPSVVWPFTTSAQLPPFDAFLPLYARPSGQIIIWPDGVFENALV